MRLAFQGSEERLDEFVAVVRDAIPPDTGVVLRGSAVTGRRWKDGAEFDAEGPGTSDLDLTLVGDEVIGLYKVTGFFLPGIHSRPISKDDPDIAPDLDAAARAADGDGAAPGQHPGDARLRDVCAGRAARPAVSRADRQIERPEPRDA